MSQACTWKSRVSGISILSNVAETLSKRGKVDGQECLHIVHRSNGDAIRNIKILCNHNNGLLAPIVNESNIVLEFCADCEEIRAYNIAAGEGHVIFENCSPIGMCTGPGNTVFVFDYSGCILQLKWDDSSTQLNVIRGIEVQGRSPDTYLSKMCYSEITNSLVIVSLNDVVNSISLADGSCSWTLSGKLRGFKIFPYGVCSNPADGFIFICNGGRKTTIFLLDPFTGYVLQVIPINNTFRTLSDICWSSSQPHLTVVGKNEDGSDSVVCYNVEDEVEI